MDFLFVGDVHATVEELPECRALIDYIYRLVSEYSIKTIVFAGDIYHNHALIYAEVQQFWIQAFKLLLSNPVDPNIIVIAGNHDLPGNQASRACALRAHPNVITVIDEALQLNDTLFCPYVHDAQKLINWSNSSSATTLVCHQTFDGSRYENGFFAGDGVDPNLIKQDVIISGHIHTPQEFGKVWYPGAPRWRTLSDANVERNLWLIRDTEAPLPFPTFDVCRPISRIVHEEPTEYQDIPVKSNEIMYLDLKGSRKWVQDRKTQYESTQIPYKIRTIYTDIKNIKVKESEGIAKAFHGYINSFTPPNQTSLDTLKDLIKKRLANGF